MMESKKRIFRCGRVYILTHLVFMGLQFEETLKHYEIKRCGYVSDMTLVITIIAEAAAF